MKPIIKWPGGKRELCPKIRELMPPTYNKYYEPFLGGGAVLLDLIPTLTQLNPKEAVVNDINPELINMYLQVKEKPERVIDFLAALDVAHETADNPKDFYYAIRSDFNSTLGSKTPTQAAQFIYLNKHCFNGLYRVNSKGEFNVPFNGKLTGGSFDPEHLREVSKQIQSVEFLCGDFEAAVKDADKGSLIFIDSPYDNLTPTSFTDYTKEGFGYSDHVRLSRLFKELDGRGCYCMLTNHDTPLIRELYRDYKIEVVDVRRSINRNGDSRKGKEVIITNY